MRSADVVSPTWATYVPKQNPLMPRSNPISDTELEVLKILWEDGPSTVHAVQARLKKGQAKRAYTTVLTLLTRLRTKGFVDAEKSGAALEFRPIVSREQLLRRRLTELADKVCDGTTGPLVHALVDGRRLSREEIASLRELVDKLDPDPKRK